MILRCATPVPLRPSGHSPLIPSRFARCGLRLFVATSLCCFGLAAPSRAQEPNGGLSPERLEQLAQRLLEIQLEAEALLEQLSEVDRRRLLTRVAQLQDATDEREEAEVAETATALDPEDEVDEAEKRAPALPRDREAAVAAIGDDSPSREPGASNLDASGSDLGVDVAARTGEVAPSERSSVRGEPPGDPLRGDRARSDAAAPPQAAPSNPPPSEVEGRAPESISAPAADLADTAPGCSPLQLLDTDGDGAVGGADRLWRHLRVWVDSNSNSRVEDREWSSPFEHNVRSIDLSLRSFSTRWDTVGDVYERDERLVLRLIGKRRGSREEGVLGIDAGALKRSRQLTYLTTDGVEASGRVVLELGGAWRDESGEVIPLQCD